MSPLSIILLCFTHGLPIIFFWYIAIEVLKRNYRRIDYILLALISFTYSLLFVEEIVRNLSDIRYSALLSSSWFSSLGLLTVCFGFHFVVITSKLDKKYSPKLLISLCYSPVILILFNILSGAQLFSTQTFEQIGMWIYPIYNVNYYVTLIGSYIANILIIAILLIAYKRATSDAEKVAYKYLIKGLTVIVIFCLTVGLLPLQSILPPYPYIYGGIYFCYILNVMMQRYQYLEKHDAQYQKLFTMNPDMIILMDSNFSIRELNPVSEQFFEVHQITPTAFFEMLNEEIKETIYEEGKINELEICVTLPDSEYYFLFYKDQLSINFETIHYIILKDITQIKNQQKEIFFLAYHDTLTGLPNRHYIFQQLQKTLPEIDVKEELLALYLIDINNLKMLNDKVGHHAGDKAITSLAKILQALVKDYGMAARLGGDEFMVFLNESRSKINQHEFIRSVQLHFAMEMKEYKNYPIGVSVGCSHYPTESKNIEDLVRIADQKMYVMKNKKAFHYR